MTKQILYKEHSQTSKSGILTVYFFAALLIAWMAYTTYRSIQLQEILFGEYFVQIAGLILLFYQGFNRYTYFVTDKALIIKEHTVFGTKTMSIPYNRIDGIYEYTREFFGRLKFRYKFRKCATIDPRPIWQLVYSIVPEEQHKKVKYGYILLKADDAFFEALEPKIPNKVWKTIDEVCFNAVLRQEAHKRGYEYDAYLKIFEEECREVERQQKENRDD